VPLRGSFESKRPEHCVYHLRPLSDAVQEESSGRQSQHLVLVFYYAVLMMIANGAKSYLLGLLIDLI